MGMLNIGLSGINTAQANLITTSHNIANAGTPGYSRQSTLQSANYPTSSGNGFYGSGVITTAVVRYYSAHLEEQLRDSHTRVNDITAYYAQVMEIDNLLGSTDSGLTTILSNFFSAIDAVTENPNDIALRQQLLTVADTLSSRVKTADLRLDEINEGINLQVIATVDQINIHAENIANLNRQIQMLRGNGQEPNDLLDKRDYEVTLLSKLINTQVFESATGAYNVFIGTGQALVMGENISRLGTRLSTKSATVEVVTFDNTVGEIELPEAVLTGGQLGGLIAVRREGVDYAKNQLGALVVGLVQTFNAQHRLGVDLNGHDGLPFFKDLEPQVNPDTSNQGNATVTASFTTPSELLAAAGGYRLDRTTNGYELYDSANQLVDSFNTLPHEYNGVIMQISGSIQPGDSFQLSSTGVVPASTNTGSGTVSVNVSNVQASDYLLTRTVSGYTLLRMTDNTYIPLPTNFPTESVVVDGMVISLSGDAVRGDSYLIRPVHDVADVFEVNITDPSEFAAALAIRTEAVSTNSGTASISAGTVNALPPQSTNAPNLRETVTIVFDNPPTSFSVTGVGTGDPVSVPYRSGAPISYNGWTIEITGTPKAGDQFIVSENQAGVADNRNAITLFGLQSEKIIQGGTNSYVGSYRTLVSDIGMKTNLAQMTGEAELAILEQKQNNRDEFSGVNLEEEAANLIRYQQAYQAASKVIQVASELFNNILQAIA